MKFINRYEAEMPDYDGDSSQDEDLCAKLTKKQKKDSKESNSSIMDSRTFTSLPKYGVIFTVENQIDWEGQVITASLYKESQPVRIEHEMLRLMMKYLNNTNRRRKRGWFCINPRTGIISYKCSNIYSSSESSTETLSQETSATIRDLFKLLDAGLPPILRLSKLEALQAPKSQKQVTLSHKLRIIQTAIACSQGSYPKVFPSNPNPERNHPLVEIDHPEFMAALESLDAELKESHKYFSTFEKVEQDAFDPASSYSNIAIVRPQAVKWTLIETTSFSQLEKGQITYSDIKDPARKEVSEVVVKKTDLKGFNKVSHEKKLLQHLKDSKCSNLLRFFADDSPSLYSQFSSGGTMSRYLKLYKEFIGLQNRLYMLIQILEVLRLLRQHKIVHADLKPQNLLLFRGLILKLTDFGQSYHPAAEGKYKPGYTLPYSSPEIFTASKEKSALNSKVDVYNFGVIMLECLFNVKPFEYRSQSEDELMEALKNRTYPERMHLCPISDSRYGPIEIMHPMYCLALKCMEPDIKERPGIDWLIFILRETYEFVSYMYF